MRRFVRGLRVAWHILRGLVIVILWFAPLVRFFPQRSRAHRARVIQAWMQRLLRLLATRVRVTGNIAAGPALLVANHISWLDIPCVLGHTQARFVAKGEVARWPLIGRLSSAAGTLYLERGAGADIARARMVAALHAGERVMIFPEGTSTDGAAVRPFHARLFQAAIEAGVPVQAVAIRYPVATGRRSRVPFVGEDTFAGHLWRLLAEPAIEAELHFLAPVGAAGQSRRALATRTHAQISTLLKAGSATPALPENAAA